MANKLQLPPAEVHKSFDEIRALQETETTDRFGRTFPTDQQLKPSYHVIRVTGALFHTQGGLEILENGRVLDERGEPLPNLFAPGGAARGVPGAGDSDYLFR